MIDYQQVLDIGLSPDRETLTARVVKVAEAMGFGLASGVLIQGRFGSSDAMLGSFGNPPEAFQEASTSFSNGLRDPLMGQLMSRPGHVTYDQGFYVAAGAADMWDGQSAFGYKHGLSLSLHASSHAEAFLIGWDGPDPLPQGGELLRLKAVLQMVALHAQEAFVRMLLPQRRVPEAELTRCEVDALQIASATVYARRRGMVLVSSPSSTALRSSVRKLGATTLAAALVRASEQGQIDR